MAAKYRKIDPRTWADEGFRSLSHMEQLIALYVLTAQSNRIGLFSFSPGKACEDLKLTSQQTFRECFANVLKILKWEWNEASRVVFIPTWWKYNRPPNPNTLKSCLDDLHDIPKTPLLIRFATHLQYLPSKWHRILKERLEERLGEHSAKRSARVTHQEQEQEQEQEQDIPLQLSSNQTTVEEIQSQWNLIEGVKRCKQVGKDLAKRVQSLIKTHPDPTWWKALFAQIGQSNFLCGRIVREGHDPFHATLEFVLRPKKLEKLLAGDYDNSGAVEGKTGSGCRYRVLNGKFHGECGKPLALGHPKYCQEHNLHKATAQ